MTLPMFTPPEHTNAMSIHKARPKAGRVNPAMPGGTVLAAGRVAVPHDEGRLGGLNNATVDAEPRTPEEEKAAVQEYHKNREAVKKAQAEAFDKKTGEPKQDDKVSFEPDPKGDAHAVLGTVDTKQAKPEEVKKNAEAEKKANAKPEEK